MPLTGAFSPIQVKHIVQIKFLLIISWLSAFLCSFAGAKKAVESYGPAGGSKAAGGDAKDDDDDFDLFGSDDEEDNDDAKRLKEERLAMYAEKKSKSMYFYFEALAVQSHFTFVKCLCVVPEIFTVILWTSHNNQLTARAVL